jgi:hypothetical protein
LLFSGMQFSERILFLFYKHGAIPGLYNIECVDSSHFLNYYFHCYFVFAYMLNTKGNVLHISVFILIENAIHCSDGLRDFQGVEGSTTKVDFQIGEGVDYNYLCFKGVPVSKLVILPYIYKFSYQRWIHTHTSLDHSMHWRKYLSHSFNRAVKTEKCVFLLWYIYTMTYILLERYKQQHNEYLLRLNYIQFGVNWIYRLSSRMKTIAFSCKNMSRFFYHQKLIINSFC